MELGREETKVRVGRENMSVGSSGLKALYSTRILETVHKIEHRNMPELCSSCPVSTVWRKVKARD